MGASDIQQDKNNLKASGGDNNIGKSLSIIIPAYNEEERIGYTIDSIRLFMDNAISDNTSLPGISDYEILVVDDGSSDNTVAVSEERGAKVLAQTENQGKGAAVKAGMLEADGDYLLFSDADLSTPIHELFRLFDVVASGDTDIAIGSRGIDYDKIKKHQPLYREFMGRTFNKIVGLLAFEGIKDTQCGFKLFSKSSGKDIFSKVTVKGFGFDVEVLYLAKKLGYNIAELPVEWHNDERTKVNPIIDPIKMLIDISRLKRKHSYLENK